ncbi:hypothetical protein SAMN05518800_6777 [Variovorax sp. YR752]|nr:hypothetical protein SAMN05518800_6777 [Variovorax sp. YR752]
MPRHPIHSATITLKLPSDMAIDAEIMALRAAGIPVDALGNAERGFLFVRFSDGWRNRANIFRWFAGDIGQGPRNSSIEPSPRRRRVAFSSCMPNR